MNKGGRPRTTPVPLPKQASGTDVFRDVVRAVYDGTKDIETLPAAASVPGAFTQEDVQGYLDRLEIGLSDTADSLALTRALLRLIPKDVAPHQPLAGRGRTVSLKPLTNTPMFRVILQSIK